jgi:hypothetical protein
MMVKEIVKVEKVIKRGERSLAGWVLRKQGLEVEDHIERAHR